MNVIRAAHQVQFFDGITGIPYRAVVVTPHPKGKGLDLLVNVRPGQWDEFSGVLGPARPGRQPGDPYWTPIP